MASGETTSENSNGDIEAVQADAEPTHRIRNDERRAVYEYVSEHGPVRRRRLRRELFPDDRRALRHHLALLRRRGLVNDDGGRVHVAVDVDRLAAPKTVDLPALDGPLRLRPATDGDRAAVVDVAQSVAEERPHPEAEAFAERLAAGEPLHRRDSDRRRVAYVAVVSDAVCGWAHLDASSRSGLCHTATLTGGVAEAHRGAGVGSELLGYAVGWAAARGYEKLYQSLSGANRTGIDFLTERGWSVEATRTDRYAVGETYADEVILSSALDG